MLLKLSGNFLLSSSRRNMIGIHELSLSSSKILQKDICLNGTPLAKSPPSCCIRKKLGSNKLIIIEGNIGVGKTTLAQKLSQSLNYQLFLEPTIENPFLEKFYSQPHKFALRLQLWILRQRYNTYVEAVRHVLTTGGGAILDRSVFSDVVFANVCRNEGYISQEGYTHYSYWRQKALEFLPLPHVTIFLDASPSVCHSRIHQRGRECEDGVPLDYLSKLHDEYKVFLKDIQQAGSEVMQFDWTDFQKEEKIISKVSQANTCQWNRVAKCFTQEPPVNLELFQTSILQELEN